VLRTVTNVLRTVTNVLRTLADEPGFAAFHRVLNRNAWSGLVLARTLLHALVTAFIACPGHCLRPRRADHHWCRPHPGTPPRPLYRPGQPLLRRGALVQGANRHHPALANRHAAGRGALRRAHLPMLTALVPSRSWCEANRRRYRPAWARALLLRLHRWLPDRLLVAIMDGEFAALELLDALSPHLIAVTRLRLDARLFDPPSERPGSIREMAKGARQPTLRTRLTDRTTVWRRAVLSNRTRWRSGRWIDYASGTAFWHHPGKPIVPIRWVLVRYPDGRRDPEAFLCTDPTVPPRTVLEWFNHRWAMEVTYEESRAHLGVESQRQWSDKAVFRTAPLLFGLYSLITLYVHQNAERLALSPRRALWYPKPAPTFADALARLRRHLWFDQVVTSLDNNDMTGTPPPLLRGLVDLACYAP
jgi:hypothetical protein